MQCKLLFDVSIFVRFFDFFDFFLKKCALFYSYFCFFLLVSGRVLVVGRLLFSLFLELLFWYVFFVFITPMRLSE